MCEVGTAMAALCLPSQQMGVAIAQSTSQRLGELQVSLAYLLLTAT